jgi:hypothetical protein
MTKGLIKGLTKNEYNKQWRVNHPTYYKQYFSEQEKKENKLIAQKKWRTKNHDLIIQYLKEWQRKNPEKMKEYKKRYSVPVKSIKSF